MAENVKKFLDLDGLKIYDGRIKAYADNAATTEASKVDTAIRKDYKVKDVDTTDNGKVALTLVDGKVGVTVNADVVKDSEYSTVKANANNSAAAWGKFLEGTLNSATNPAPKLSELATTSAVTSAIATAKSEAITEAGKLDGALETEITTAYQGADDVVKSTLIGAKGNASEADTIYGAKKYADEKAATAKAAADAAKAAANAAQSTADTAVANAATADGKAVAAQNTANGAVEAIKTINETTIPTLQSSLEGKITTNTNLINSTKSELIGGDLDTKNSNSIKGAKLYADDLASGLSTRIDSIVAGGVAFKGVVSALPSTPKNGDLIIIGKEGGIQVGDITYNKDYEYIYFEGAWYELGDSDKNAKAIAEVKSTADSNATAIQHIETEYKAADTAIKESIKTLSDAAVKSIAGGNSTYVTVEASAKDETGKVTLTVSDTIAATFDTQASVDNKISTAKNALIGNDSDVADASTIKGAKKYTDDLVNELSARVDSIVAGGVAFKGVVTSIPSVPKNGDLVIMASEYTDGSVTYKKDYEYIYSNGTWYELGDSDKNAKAIATVESKVNINTSAISTMDTAYKAADSDLESKINVIGNALIGNNTDGSDADTIWGAKNYATSLVSALVNSFVAITDEQINGLFTV